MATPHELYRLVQAAAAYDIVIQCADGTMTMDGMPQDFAELLRLMLTDRDFRAVAHDAWVDLFRGRGMPTAERAKQLYQEIEEWIATLKEPEFLSASDMDGTPPTSKAN